MAARDAETRRLAATVASNTYRADPEGRRRVDRADRMLDEVPSELQERYASEVDPESALDPRERAKRARAAYRRDQALDALAALRRVEMRPR